MLLIFDLDNTLIDRDAAFVCLIKQLFHHYQQPLPQAELALILQQDNHGRTPRRPFCHFLMQRYAFLPQVFAELWQHFTHLPDFITPDYPLQQMLTRLATKHELRLLTNGSISMQEAKLRQAQLSGFFTKIVISEAVGFSKPQTAIFHHILGACPPAQSMMIGDDPLRDIAPAVQLGMGTVWVSPQPDPKVTCSAHIASIYQLEQILTHA